MRFITLENKNQHTLFFQCLLYLNVVLISKTIHHHQNRWHLIHKQSPHHFIFQF